MEELMMLKPVADQEIDSLFIEIQRLTEWYIKADGQGEAMNAKWVRAAFIKNLPKEHHTTFGNSIKTSSMC